MAALQHYGHYLGLAFQMQDDVLGLWGEADAVGKPIGSDLLRNKRSLPILYALHLEHPIRQQLREAFARGVTVEEAAQLATMMEQAGVQRYCDAMVQERMQRARKALQETELMAEPKHVLLDLADYLVERRA